MERTQQAEPPTELAPNRSTEPEETDAQRRAKAMIAADANTRQVDLVNELGVSKAYASELWHTFHAAGKLYKPTPPTDAFGREQITINVDDPEQAETLAAIRQAIESGAATVKGKRQ